MSHVRVAEIPDVRSVQDPTWEDIEALIRLLDGEAVDTVILTGADDGSDLTIFGGNDGRYGVECLKAETAYHLVDPTIEDDEDTLVIVNGGQECETRRRDTVSLTQALSAAAFFAKTGRREPAAIWEPSY